MFAFLLKSMMLRVTRSKLWKPDSEILCLYCHTEVANNTEKCWENGTVIKISILILNQMVTVNQHCWPHHKCQTKYKHPLTFGVKPGSATKVYTVNCCSSAVYLIDYKFHVMPIYFCPYWKYWPDKVEFTLTFMSDIRESQEYHWPD